jgi:hypothetical protein
MTGCSPYYQNSISTEIVIFHEEENTPSIFSDKDLNYKFAQIAIQMFVFIGAVAATPFVIQTIFTLDMAGWQKWLSVTGILVIPSGAMTTLFLTVIGLYIRSLPSKNGDWLQEKRSSPSLLGVEPKAVTPSLPSTEKPTFSL